MQAITQLSRTTFVGSISRTRLFTTLSPIYAVASGKKGIAQSAKASASAKKTKQTKEKPLSLLQQKRLEKPKLPVTSYALFLKDRFVAAKSNSSEKLDLVGLSKKFSEEWRSIDDATKSKYKAQYDANLKEYETAKEAFYKKYPKRPASKYAQFVKEGFEDAYLQTGSATDAIKELARRWKNSR